MSPIRVALSGHRITPTPSRRGAHQSARRPSRVSTIVRAEKQQEKVPWWKDVAEKLDLGPAGWETGGTKVNVSEALDFASARSEEDYELLEDSKKYVDRELGVAMTEEQAGALRRKIGGTYGDFMKDWVEPTGDCVDDGIIFVDGSTGEDISTSTSGSYVFPIAIITIGLVFFATCLVVSQT